MIKIENLNKKFGKNEVLKDINLEIKKGEVLAIIWTIRKWKKHFIKMYEFVRNTDKWKGYIRR